jgi:hypothetical protein
MKSSRFLRYLSAALLASATLYFAGRALIGQQAPAPQQLAHPHPRPMPAASTVTVSGSTVTVATGQSTFAPSDPFLNPPGTNLLPNVYTDAYDTDGNVIPNTLPSTPAIPYNLHDGEPVVKLISSQGYVDVPCPAPSRPISMCPDPGAIPSPQDDLKAFFTAIRRGACTIRNGVCTRNDAAIRTSIAGAIDILEGNPIKNRPYYSGMPLLHYKAGEDVKKVDPTTHNVNIHQVWYDTHIESDTAYLDVRPAANVPWTITYTVDVLKRGHDDFSPFAMFYQTPATPASMPVPGLAMDQSFYNMEDGTETIFKIKMPPGKYFNLAYTWGWRAHPPRAQATENACKTVPYKMPAPTDDCATTPGTLVDWERRVFFNNGKPDKPYAIGKLSKYAPALVMWNTLHDAQDALNAKDYDEIVRLFNSENRNLGIAWIAWDDWRDRTKLPRTIPKKYQDMINNDKSTDLSLVYLNNTMFAHFTNGSRMDYPDWTKRGTTIRITLYNGDYFDHGYQNVDFGGARGWENQFKSSVKTGGSGCWFTFGRAWWYMNIPAAPALMNQGIPGTVTVPAAKHASTKGGDDEFGIEKVNITYNYEPSRRLRFYQFDPVHHDVAIFSVH